VTEPTDATEAAVASSTTTGPTEDDEPRRELILYATPTGPLADTIGRYWRRVEASTGPGPTTAQTYPPHCTLTGFFRRRGARAEAAIADLVAAVDRAGAVPSDAVEVVGLRTTEEWVGLELRSHWLQETTATVAAAHRPGADEDALRLKDWLHLSLAYGVDELADHATLAIEVVDPDAPVGWELALWERRADGTWARHGIGGSRANDR
jgi:ubiquitin-associated SH3 domain-containing protein